MAEPNFREEMDLMIKVERQLHSYVPGPLQWIARQTDTATREWTDTYCIAIGNGACAVTVDEARNPDDALIRRLATEILGYPPGSPQDIQRRQDEAEKFIAQYTKERDRAIKMLAYWQVVKDELTTPTPPAADITEEM